MQKIKLVVVGTIKENYFKEAIAEYMKRLSRFCDFEIIEVPEVNINSNHNDLEIVEAESKKIVKLLSGFVVVFDIKGKEFTSNELGNIINARSTYSDSLVTFVIGGSLGLNDEIRNRANVVLRMGKQTLPHQLMRVVACEQIYRAFTIINNVKYHK